MDMSDFKYCSIATILSAGTHTVGIPSRGASSLKTPSPNREPSSAVIDPSIVIIFKNAERLMLHAERFQLIYAGIERYVPSIFTSLYFVGCFKLCSLLALLIQGVFHGYRLGLYHALVADGPAQGAYLLAHGVAQHYQALHEGVWPGWAAGHIHIYRQELVHALHYAIDVVHTAG